MVHIFLDDVYTTEKERYEDIRGVTQHRHCLMEEEGAHKGDVFDSGTGDGRWRMCEGETGRMRGRG